MLGFPVMRQRQVVPNATLVGASAYVAGATPAPIILPAGAQTGDLCIIFAGSELQSAITGGAGGWSKYSSYIDGDNTRPVAIFQKVLAASDLTADLRMTVVAGNTNLTVMAVAAYRVPTAATFKGLARSTSSPVTVAGFTKNDNSKGLVGVAWDMDYNGTNLPTPPAGFTTRCELFGNAFSPTVQVADILVPANYNGANLAWGFGPGSGYQVALVFELV